MNKFWIEQKKARIREIELMLANNNSLGRRLASGEWWLPRARAAKERELEKLKEELKVYGEEGKEAGTCKLYEVQTCLPDAEEWESHNSTLQEEQREGGSISDEDLPEFLRLRSTHGH